MEDPWREMYTIAVIDDDIFIGDMLEKALSKERYQVIRAYSGTEALLLLERRRPDLILLDLMLPGLSGEQVIEKISDIPVIVVSARTSVDDKVTLLTGGAVDYVTKHLWRESALRSGLRKIRGRRAGKQKCLFLKRSVWIWRQERCL